MSNAKDDVGRGATIGESGAPNGGQTGDAPDGIVITSLGGLCPVQGTGTIDGVSFYFRARYRSWTIEVGEGNTAILVDAPESEWPRLEALDRWGYGEDFGEDEYGAGYMTCEEATGFIRASAALYRAAVQDSPLDTPVSPETGAPSPTSGTTDADITQANKEIL